ncbi:hypothetical protein [Aureimonas altamirensis]|uniref:hypothetical protein n=1 Tax=Aureimonas altamirensis TaxID=370622 RepID=UPI00333C9DCB
MPAKNQNPYSAEDVLRIQLALSDSLKRIRLFNSYSTRIERSFGDLAKELQTGEPSEAENASVGDTREIVEAEGRRILRIEMLWQMQTYRETGAFGDFDAFWTKLTPDQQAAPDNCFKSWYLTVWDAGRMLRLPSLLSVGQQNDAYLSMKEAVAQYRTLMSDPDTRAAAPFPQANQYYKYDGGKIRLADDRNFTERSEGQLALRGATVGIVLLEALNKTLSSSSTAENKVVQARYWLRFLSESANFAAASARFDRSFQADETYADATPDGAGAVVGSVLSAAVYIASIIGRSLDDSPRNALQTHIDNIGYASDALKISRSLFTIGPIVEPALATSAAFKGAGTLVAGTAQILSTAASAMTLADMEQRGTDSRIIAAASVDLAFQIGMAYAVTALAASGVGVLGLALLATANFSQFAVADMYFDMAEEADARYGRSGWLGDKAIGIYYRQCGGAAIVNGMPALNILSSVMSMATGDDGIDMSVTSRLILTDYANRIDNDPAYRNNPRYAYDTREGKLAAAATAFWDDGFDSRFSATERQEFASRTAELKKTSRADRVRVYVTRQLDADAEMMGWASEGTIRQNMRSGRTFLFSDGAGGASAEWDPFARKTTDYDLGKPGDTSDTTQYVTFATPFTGVEQEVREDVGSGKKASNRPVLPKTLKFSDGAASTTFDARNLAPEVRTVTRTQVVQVDGRPKTVSYSIENVDRMYGSEGGIELSMGGGSDRVIAAARAMLVDGGSGFSASETDIIDYSGYARSGATVAVAATGRGRLDVVKRGVVEISYRYVKEESQGKNKPKRYTAVTELRTYDLNGNTDSLVNVEGVAGTANADTFSGGMGNILLGLQGDDTFAEINNDTIMAGEGSDMVEAISALRAGAPAPHGSYVDGGEGNDRITLRWGNDSVVGGAGRDTLFGGVGDDILFGDFSDATIAVAAIAYADRIDGGDGNDTLSGGFGSDTLGGGAGNDLLVGNDDDDILDGGAGSDRLSGDGGRDTIDAGTGDDVAWGGDGDDILKLDDGHDAGYGGAGDDTLLGGEGADRLYGQSGSDRLYGGAGNDVLSGDEGDDALFGGDGGDTLIGGAGNDVLYGEAGDDCLYDQSGRSILKGGDGDDIIVLGAASITSGSLSQGTIADGEDGDDLASFRFAYVPTEGETTATPGIAASLSVGRDAAGNAFTAPSARLLSRSTPSGMDALFGIRLLGIENLEGTIGRDILTGDAGANVLIGREGDDTLAGMAGDDLLYGGRGTDVLLGGQGHDVLLGGSGKDLLYGGAGGDTFVFEGMFGADALYVEPGASRSQQNGDILLFMDADYRNLYLRTVAGGGLEIGRILTPGIADPLADVEGEACVLIDDFGSGEDSYADVALVARCADGWAVLTGAPLQALIFEMNVFFDRDDGMMGALNVADGDLWADRVRPAQEALWTTQAVAA